MGKHPINLSIPMKSLLTTLSILALMLPQVQGASSPGSNVTTSVFGKLPLGAPVTLYTLTNKRGASVSIMDYGATVVNLRMPDRRGKLDDVVLGFDTLASYISNKPYFGATVGRYANRIAKGRFTLDGKVYHLPINNGENSLHGGKVGFNKKMWTAHIVSQHPAAVAFSLASPNGDQGYPGTLKTTVTYILNDQNALIILYGASTDRPTVLNLTNHSYFNLAGAGNGQVLNHRVKINAFYYTPTDAHLIPTGEIRSLIGTPFDFRKFTPIGAAIQQTGGNPIGYDHNYVLAKAGSKRFALAAEVYEPTSGRFLKVFTDQPGVQFYTANFLNGIPGKGGKKYPQYGAFCLETQHFPDSPNHQNFPSTVLRPGEIFRSATVYKFGVR
jgi:aldose 1-epimerase